jgi:hypothetical protein
MACFFYEILSEINSRIRFKSFQTHPDRGCPGSTRESQQKMGLLSFLLVIHEIINVFLPLIFLGLPRFLLINIK